MLRMHEKLYKDYACKTPGLMILTQVIHKTFYKADIIPLR